MDEFFWIQGAKAQETLRFSSFCNAVAGNMHHARRASAPQRQWASTLSTGTLLRFSSVSYLVFADSDAIVHLIYEYVT